MSRGPLAAALALLLGAGPGYTQFQSVRRGDPVLLTLQGKLRRDSRDYPNKERLAFYRHYDLLDGTGKLVGFFPAFSNATRHPAFRISTTDGRSRGGLRLNRRTLSGWSVINPAQNRIGRLVRMRVVAGEYEWRNRDDEPIGALVPAAGTPFYSLRGGEELRELFVERFRIPIPEILDLPDAPRDSRFSPGILEEGRPAAALARDLRAEAARRRFELLYGDGLPRRGAGSRR